MPTITIKAYLIGAVTSGPRPQSNQKDRSSGDIGTDVAPTNTQNINFVVTNTDGTINTGVSFNVKQDVSGGSDGTVYSGVMNSSAQEYKPYRTLYIADPTGTSSNFVVYMYATGSGITGSFGGTTPPKNVPGKVLCAIRSKSTAFQGQQSRSSSDFSTEEQPEGTTALYWTVTDDNGNELPNVTFDVKQDVSGGDDSTTFTSQKSGSKTGYVNARTLYIANPRGADGDFIVTAHACS